MSDLLSDQEAFRIRVAKVQIPHLPMQSCFKVPTWLHRLLMFPNFALNSMERSETMLNEFYDSNYLYKGVSRSPRGWTGS